MGQRVIQLVEIDNGRMMNCKQVETKGENVEEILLLEYRYVCMNLFQSSVNI